ncbi:tight adherence protein B [Caldicellulosiruptor bescii]|uniref:Type II secretion system protein n=2 Tax=Caldicellulosiruptor bescii TaxID=31899 RepID=B9MNI9_CALBD|nr:type II secretion system F family protein [Caldicellulosiruptor bescii]ACM61520.1 type II secretion system protein [Caldicellulosiruptor bescii DSM 6725]PBC88668.1 tight adherence protein B [Caldicellulosiruptor bescii]PBC91851.1 tight adherence protein B [Caldicellulosiruptor bescii]PBD02738.1 tight adherence protein B [Caldicellulosiruptor bescii]PBD07645.1 tight adherence protein B [Caldicellulosiruptor bescii]
MLSLLLGIITFFVLFLFLAYYEEKVYEIRKKLSRQLIRPDESLQKYTFFGFLGDIYDRIDRQLKSAEVKISTDDFIMYYLYFAVFCFVLAVILNQLTYFVVLIVSSFIVIKIILDYMSTSKRFRFEQRFGEFTQNVAIMLKGTPNLMAVLFQAKEEEQDLRLRKEIETILSEVQSGTTLEQALKNFKERNNFSNIVSTWVDSVIFANLSGASISDVCMNASRKINDKLSRARLIRKKTARLKSVMIAIVSIILITLGMVLFLFPEAKESYSTAGGKIILAFVLSLVIASTYYMLKTADDVAKR